MRRSGSATRSIARSHSAALALGSICSIALNPVARARRGAVIRPHSFPLSHSRPGRFIACVRALGVRGRGRVPDVVRLEGNEAARRRPSRQYRRSTRLPGPGWQRRRRYRAHVGGAPTRIGLAGRHR
jgi:hypothetical protein